MLFSRTVVMENFELEKELSEAVNEGRWKSDQEREEQKATRTEQARDKFKLTERKRQMHQRQWASLGLLTGACLLPPLWPVALVGSAMMFPRTLKRLALFSVFFASSCSVLIGSVIWLTVIAPQRNLAPSSNQREWPSPVITNRGIPADK